MAGSVFGQPEEETTVGRYVVTTDHDEWRLGLLFSEVNTTTDMFWDYYNNDDDVYSAAGDANVTASVIRHSLQHVIIFSIVIVIIMLIIVVGNGLVIVAIATDLNLRGLQNWFIASLAVSDLFVGLFVMPLSLANELMGYWAFGKVMCELWLSTDVLLCTASILNLCLISLDRYWSITRALTYIQQRTRRRAMFMISVVWVMSMVICLPPLVGWKRPQPVLEQYALCVLSEEIGYVVYSSVGSFYLPLVVMVLVYLKIYLAARKRARRNLVKEDKKKNKTKPEVPVCRQFYGVENKTEFTASVLRDDMSFDNSCWDRNKESSSLADQPGHFNGICIDKLREDSQWFCGVTENADKERSQFGYRDRSEVIENYRVNDEDKERSMETNNDTGLNIDLVLTNGYAKTEIDDDAVELEVCLLHAIDGTGCLTSPSVNSNNVPTSVSDASTRNDPRLCIKYKFRAVDADSIAQLSSDGEDFDDNSDGVARCADLKRNCSSYEASSSSVIPLFGANDFKKAILVSNDQNDDNSSELIADNVWRMRETSRDICDLTSGKSNLKGKSKPCVNFEEAKKVGESTKSLENRSPKTEAKDLSMASKDCNAVTDSKQKNQPVQANKCSGVRNDKIQAFDKYQERSGVCNLPKLPAEVGKKQPLPDTGVCDPEAKKKKLARARERRATVVLGIVMASFIGCWLPFFFIYPLSLVFDLAVPEQIFAFIFWLGYCNSALNPIIYTIFNREFRQAFASLIFGRRWSARGRHRR